MNRIIDENLLVGKNKISSHNDICFSIDYHYFCIWFNWFSIRLIPDIAMRAVRHGHRAYPCFSCFETVQNDRFFIFLIFYMILEINTIRNNISKLTLSLESSTAYPPFSAVFTALYTTENLVSPTYFPIKSQDIIKYRKRYWVIYQVIDAFSLLRLSQRVLSPMRARRRSPLRTLLHPHILTWTGVPFLSIWCKHPRNLYL